MSKSVSIVSACLGGVLLLVLVGPAVFKEKEPSSKPKEEPRQEIPPPGKDDDAGDQGDVVEKVDVTETEDEKFFKQVMGRLLSSGRVRVSYPEKFAWPPNYFVKLNSDKEINAYASIHKVHGATLDNKTGKIRPIVMVTEGMLHDIIKGDENSLAVIMGHEIAHLTHDHVSGQLGETAVLLLAFGRDQEIDADLEGLRYAIAAGYPYRIGVAKVYQAMRKLDRASSFEGLSRTHPTWEDRLVFLDRAQSQLWSSMSAFQNGFLFLEMEQYVAAIQCFKAVVAEFPDCYEAWANLGYAQLMHYCDGFDDDDLRQFNIGQIVAGAFYSRPASLEARVRGIDEKLWQSAVKSLKKSLELKPDLALPRATLGVAYLVHPEGKHVKEASKWFEEALPKAKEDPELQRNPQAIAAFFVNSGVADLARGDTKMAAQKFDRAVVLADIAAPTRLLSTLEGAIQYNQALLDAGSEDIDKKKAARAKFETYLLSASPDAAWWTLAFERYTKLSNELELKARPRAKLAERDGPELLRLVTSVTVGKEPISLSAPLGEAVNRLGIHTGVAMPLYPESKIVRWHFDGPGIDLLGKDKVMAIFLTNAKAPPVVVRGAGVASKARELRVGMSEEDAKNVLKDQGAEWSPRPIDDLGVEFVSYPALGLAIRFVGKRVQQIAIARVPRKSLAGE